MIRFFSFLGRTLEEAMQGTGQTVELFGRAALQVRHCWKRRRFLLDQLYTCGIRPLPVVLVVALFTGMILALQTGIELDRFGAKDRIASIIGLGLCREMGPFMTALILTASVGSGIAAEIGTMKVSEEIDALEILSIRPESFLVMPRLVAMAIVTPLLTFVTDIVGILGGCLVSATRLRIAPEQYLKNVVESLSEVLTYGGLPKDLYTGLVKAFVFGVIIATVGSSAGLRASGGAIGVGRATRSSVIQSFVLVIVVGYYLTSFFYT
ncbi:MAG: ABC transporter permease [Planctomycetes bacterium]|nr:ABC transporter permease [Planctomycetota bacterium]